MKASRWPTPRTRSGPRRSPRSSARAWPRPSKERPFGYLVREAPAEDVKELQQLAGHLQENWFITKFRKIFARDEMNDDLRDGPGSLQRRGRQLGVRRDSADVAAMIFLLPSPHRGRGAGGEGAAPCGTSAPRPPTSF